jgi:hypothetical protein
MKRCLEIKSAVLFTAFLLLIPFCPSQLFSADIEGIILSSSGPVENANVYAYKKFQDLKEGIQSYKSEAGEKKGFYRLALPPGRYYLTASGSVDGKDYFSFHGANPVNIGEKKLWVPFMVLPEKKEIITGSASAKLTGKVTFSGNPVKNAHVSIYSPMDPAFRGMGYFTNTTDDRGFFRFNPEPGEYIVIARKRKNFRGIRPLKKGDLFCYPSANPVSVDQNSETFIEVPCYPKDDLKAFLDEEVYPAILVKKSGENSIRFRENIIDKKNYTFKIKGKAVDRHGKPVKDLYVMAYKGKPSKMFKMLYVRTMPEYMVMSDADGHFMIDAVEEGTYYMVARELIGDAPSKGEYYGLYEGNTDHAVVLTAGSNKDVNIVVSRVMAEDKGQNTENRRQNKEQRTKNKDKKTEIKNFKYTEDTVLKTDTIWSGDIFIRGTVHVMRGVTLTIAPGTVVRFKKIDENRDGVGDSRIKVSGRLVAEGSYDKRIRFTSAEKKPDKMDWSYLLFFVSGDDNSIKYCIFEYAFTGVQVHFSKAGITDSVFERNHEGIRFGRTELFIGNNDISDNTYGIRFTRLEGPVEIRNNNIRNNDIGIFHVPSNQNIVDFSETFAKKGTYHRWQPVVRYNNISYNDEYNYRLGERQGYNILLRDNWWGSKEDDVIADHIFDEKKDVTLGSVVFKPFFSSPVKSAGVRTGG